MRIVHPVTAAVLVASAIASGCLAAAPARRRDDADDGVVVDVGVRRREPPRRSQAWSYAWSARAAR